MATGKRYYWMKLKESFMTSDTIDYFMSQPNGANYVVLYQMLCLKTINTGGRLSRTIGEIIIPYDAEKIQRDCKWFSIDTVRVALELYKAVGLIYVEQDGTLVLADHKNLVGSETDYAEKNRRLRASKKPEPYELPPGHIVSSDVSDEVSESVPTDIDTRDRDQILDIRDRDKENRGKKKTAKKADAFSEFAGDDAELLNALKEFEQMRVKMKKPMTDRAKSMLVKKLSTQFSSDIWIDVLKQSIYKCWLDVYPLKGDHNQSHQGNSQMDDLRQLHDIFSEEE